MSEFCEYVMNHMNVFVATDDLQLLVIFLLLPINTQSILLKI